MAIDKSQLPEDWRDDEPGTFYVELTFIFASPGSTTALDAMRLITETIAKTVDLHGAIRGTIALMTAADDNDGEERHYDA